MSEISNALITNDCKSLYLFQNALCYHSAHMQMISKQPLHQEFMILKDLKSTLTLSTYNTSEHDKRLWGSDTNKQKDEMVWWSYVPLCSERGAPRCIQVHFAKTASIY